MRSFPRRRTRTGVTMVLAASLVALAFTSSPPSAASSGDDAKPGHDKLHRAKHRLDRNINKKADDVDEISKRLVRAQSRVEGAWSELRSAKQHLRDVKEQVHEAAVRDRQMQDLLQQAIIKLQDARTDLYQGAQDVDGPAGGPRVVRRLELSDRRAQRAEPRRRLRRADPAGSTRQHAGVGHRARQADGGPAAVPGDQGAAPAHRAAGRGHQGGCRGQAGSRPPRSCRRKIELKQAARDAKEQVRNQLGNFAGRQAGDRGRQAA